MQAKALGLLRRLTYPDNNGVVSRTNFCTQGFPGRREAFRCEQARPGAVNYIAQAPYGGRSVADSGAGSEAPM